MSFIPKSRLTGTFDIDFLLSHVHILSHYTKKESSCQHLL